MQNLTDEQKLTAEVNEIIAQRVEIGHEYFARQLVGLAKTEATRVDKLVTVKNMIPQPVDAGYPIKFKYAEKHYQPPEELNFNRYATSQYLSAREPALRTRVFDSLQRQTIDVAGNPVKVDFKQNYLNQVRIDRPRMKRYCRQDSYITRGFVGEFYPKDWSDYQAIQGIISAARDKDVDLAFMPIKETNSGTLSCTILFPDLTYDENTSGFTEFVQDFQDEVGNKGHAFIHNTFAANYTNNPFGKGSMEFSGSFYRSYCSNLMRTIDQTSFVQIAHSTTKSYYESVLEVMKRQLGDNWDEEPLNAEIEGYIERGESLTKNPLARRQFYELFGETVLQSARAGYQNFVKLADRAQGIGIASYEAEIEEQAKFYGLKNSIPLLKSLALSDPTLDRDNFNLYFMSQLVSRLANSKTISTEKSLELQDSGYSILKGKALTPLIKA